MRAEHKNALLSRNGRMRERSWCLLARRFQMDFERSRDVRDLNFASGALDVWAFCIIGSSRKIVRDFTKNVVELECFASPL